MAKRPFKPLHPWPRTAPGDPSTPLGVDVAACFRDLQNIIRAYFARAGVPKCMPVEDVIQEILLTIVRRNHTNCAFNPKRGSFAHYVWLVSSNVCRKMVSKSRKSNKIPEPMIISIDAVKEGQRFSGDENPNLMASIEPSFTISMEDRIDYLRGSLSDWPTRGMVQGAP